jgi:hypothetical protein
MMIFRRSISQTPSSPVIPPFDRGDTHKVSYRPTNPELQEFTSFVHRWIGRGNSILSQALMRMAHYDHSIDDLAEHERTYAMFRKLAMWGAFGTPVLLAFVLYWTV